MRYEEYKTAEMPWINKIPAHWSQIRNGGLFEYHQDKVGADFGKYQLLSLSVQGIRVKNILDTSGKVPASYEGYQKVSDGDMVFCLFDLDCSAVFSGLSELNGMITSAYDVMTPKCKIVNPKYLDYYFKAVFAGRYYKIFAKSVRYTINYDVFKALKSPVPPREEQDQIVRYLDWKVSCINKLIHGYQRQIKLLEERRLFVINEAVTKGIENGISFKDSGIRWIGEIPAHWHIVSLKRCATLRSGITLGKKYPRNVELIEVPYLRVANVQNGYIDTSDVATLLVTQEEAEKYRLSAGEVLMTEGGDRDKLGRGSVWNGSISPCIHQNHVYAVKTNEQKLNNRFLEYLTVSNVAREYFDLTATKTTNLASTNSSKVLAFPIPLPPIDEQQRIVEYLIQSDEKIQIAKSKIQKQLSLMQEYRTRLISDVVTGQMDVRSVVVPDYTPEDDTEENEADDETTDEEVSMDAD